MEQDEELKLNKEIEDDITAFSNAPSDETLAVLLTTIRKRMKEHGQLVVSVEMIADGSLTLKAREIKGQGKWFVAFTSFEQQLLGNEVNHEQVMSTFKADIEQLFRTVQMTDEVKGIAVNPWDKSFLLTKEMINIIFPK